MNIKIPNCKECYFYQDRKKAKSKDAYPLNVLNVVLTFYPPLFLYFLPMGFRKCRFVIHCGGGLMADKDLPVLNALDIPNNKCTSINFIRTYLNYTIDYHVEYTFQFNSYNVRIKVQRPRAKFNDCFHCT